MCPLRGFREQGNKGIYFRETREQVVPPLGGSHACLPPLYEGFPLYTKGTAVVMLYETKHGLPRREDHSIDFYPQCFNNPEPVTRTV